MSAAAHFMNGISDIRRMAIKVWLPSIGVSASSGMPSRSGRNRE